MFGYVTVYEKLVSEADFAVFKEYYCGLCKAMGRYCSQLTRLGLSYDITFLAIVLSSLNNADSEKEHKSCIAHPFRKRDYVVNDAAVNYAADMGVLLDYYKLLDDWKDERSIKALAGLLLFRVGKKRAFARNRKKSLLINEYLKKLSTLEAAECSSIDECADCFAKILEALFTPDFITDETQIEILKWFGYNIGRWIYVIDALNDMEKDYKSGEYNPFNAGFGGGDYKEYVKKLRLEKDFTLTYTLSNAAAAFDLLDIKRNKSLLEGIIYDCLKTKQLQILNSGEQRKESETLPKGKDNEPI